MTVLPVMLIVGCIVAGCSSDQSASKQSDRRGVVAYGLLGEAGG